MEDAHVLDSLIDESGSGATYQIALHSNPFEASADIRSEVTVILQPSSPRIEVYPREVVFFAADWDEPKTVEGVAVDGNVDGPLQYYVFQIEHIVFGNASSKYNTGALRTFSGAFSNMGAQLGGCDCCCRRLL